MAAILHTADVHLREGAPERLAALRTVLDVAAESDVQAVTIGGDLFDRPRDVEAFRPTLRNDSFTDLPFDVLLIPGNHDVAAFRGDTFFGDACTVALDEPFEHHELAEDDVRITAVPYAEGDPEELLIALEGRETYEGTEVLLVHCTLDVGVRPEATGEERMSRYLPVTPEEVAALEFDYVLAGHHHDPREERLSAGTFVYPGTPASTRSSETGRRRAVRLDPEGGLEFVPLETYYRAVREFTVLPGEEAAVLDDVTGWVDESVDALADATVHVDGFHGLDEGAFNERLAAAAGPADVRDETRAVGRLRNNPLYRRFEAKLEATDWEEATRDGVRRRTLEAYSNLRGELP